MNALLACVLAAVAGGALTPAEPKPPARLFGLVVGTNRSDDPAVMPLLYADDDAIKGAELLLEFGAEVALLVAPDADSQRLYAGSDALRRASLPTKAALTAAVAELNQHLDAARREGRRSELFFLYSGHGGIDRAEGYVQLEDGRLTRGELRALLTGIRSDIVHVVIDACKSYFAVFDRGAGGSRQPIQGNLLLDSSVALPSNIGVLLSTSSAADSHEWEGFASGVFSHEFRSALRGGADLDGNGAVTYEEAAAFIWAANASIDNPRYRPSFLARAPGGVPGGSVALLARPRGRGSLLEIGPGVDSHIYVEDAKGVRLADLHPAAARTVTLLLPDGRPLFVRQPRAGLETSLPEGPRIRLASLSFHGSAAARARGAELVAFTSLFARAFDSDCLRELQATAASSEQTPAPRGPSWLGPSLAIATGVSALAGGGITAMGYSRYRGVRDDDSGVERDRLNRRIDGYNRGALACFSVAALSLAAWVVDRVWLHPDPVIELTDGSGERSAP